ncbi:MAG TPA: nuclear transport factor 2 family protein [Terriglobales bacterium]|nr:nuclear transport factor 2 family protein [Terriglobales bacterium]HYW37025.1 nuclear transport factor 2 family protein [Terriglobales bacterium]
MRRTAKKRSQGARTKRDRTIAQTRAVDAAGMIRQTGNDWARHWNAGELDEVVAAYAPDAVYLPPHHPAVHGRDSIREYLKAPLSHGVSDLAFDVTYIKQQGPVAWDVGTYRMNVPVNGEMRKEDHGKYLTVWRRVGKKWLIAADAWSSDLPPSR